MSSDTNHYLPTVYQIRIKGHLINEQWEDWFKGLNIKLIENSETLLTGSVEDQAALYGILKKICDLGMPLISVNQVKSNRPTHTDTRVITGS
ncbi:MAG: hypothetical protein GY707_04680 [Desulfobacteraceae bacterium]|nr:hypothetical protein [Desulfobacteraceae bacterium]